MVGAVCVIDVLISVVSGITAPVDDLTYSRCKSGKIERSGASAWTYTRQDLFR
jgi:hypothetical protein